VRTFGFSSLLLLTVVTTAVTGRTVVNGTAVAIVVARPSASVMTIDDVVIPTSVDKIVPVEDDVTSVGMWSEWADEPADCLSTTPMEAFGLVADVTPFSTGAGFVVIVELSALVLALVAEVPLFPVGVGFVTVAGISVLRSVNLSLPFPAGVLGEVCGLAIDVLSVVILLDVGVTVTAVGTKALGFVAETLIVVAASSLVIVTAAAVA
jgi:hypothetical protein